MGMRPKMKVKTVSRVIMRGELNIPTLRLLMVINLYLYWQNYNRN